MSVPVGHHLGTRASALLDGQLSAVETERAWAHVQQCQACHDQIQRESWVKRRLACLSVTPSPSMPSAALKGSLMDPTALVAGHPWHEVDRHRRPVSMLAISGGAIGAAMIGVIAIGTAPAVAPTADRRTPETTSTSFFVPDASVRPIVASGRE